MEKQAKAKAMNAFFTSDVPQGREYDANGNLRITLRFMRTGLLKYAPTPDTFPDGVPPDAIGPDGQITVLVEPDELGDPESLRSLQGLDGLRRHEWATPDQPRDDTGSVAGEPRFDGEYVVGGAVIKDRPTITLLELPDGDPNKLVEVSAAYTHVIDWTPGEYQGQRYAGKQRQIRYNHYTLLPRGEGRAGPEVGVMNSKEKQLSEPKEDGGILVWLKSLKGKTVRVFNADDAERVAELDAKAENEDGEGAPPAADLPTPEEIASMRDTIAALTAQKDELESQIAELRSALDGGAPEEAVDEAIEEREEFVEVMNSIGIDKAQAMNAIKENKLRGAGLRAFAMNSWRKAKGMAELTPEQTENAVAVNARWDEFKAGLSAAPAKTTVVGALPFAKATNKSDRAAMQNDFLSRISPRFAKKENK